MRCYITPSNASSIEYVVAFIRVQHYRAKLMVAGDFNVNLKDPGVTPRSEAIADELAAASLLDMVLHFFPRRNQWLMDRCT